MPQAFLVDDTGDNYIDAPDDLMTADTNYRKVTRTQKIFCMVLCVLLIAGFAVAVGIVASRNTGDRAEAEPTSAPSPRPPSNPLSKEELQALLSEISADSGLALSYVGTPHFSAYSWLVATNDPNLLSNRNRTIQRYALATLYFGTEGLDWIKNDFWMTQENECGWYTDDAVRCDGAGNIVNLDLSSNQMKGTLPEEIGLLSMLQMINFSGNRLSRQIPESLWQLTSLKSLKLKDNELSGTLSSAIGELTNLQTLSLYLNSLSGSIPTQIGRNTNLDHLDLSLNKFEGSLPKEIGILSKLTILNLESNPISGNLPIDLFFLARLEQLSFADAALSGQRIPPEISWLSSLEWLKIERCGLIGSIPSEIEALENLKTIELHGNDLSGSIPSSIGSVSDLNLLDLSDNRLNSTIPSELGRLPDLQFLNLRGNDMTGEIPVELSNITAFRTEFDFRDNAFSGSVPFALCEQSCCAKGTITVDDNIQPCEPRIACLTCFGDTTETKRSSAP